MSSTVREVEAEGLYWRVFGRSTERGGDGIGATETPLVVLHGLFGAGDNWRGQAEALSADRLVFVPDMPDHGRSRHTEELDFRTVSQELWVSLLAAAASVGVRAEQYAILGHSMGGKAAMAMAFERPQRTERIISADITPRAYPSSHEQIFDAMEAVAKASVRSRSEADRYMADQIPAKAIRMFLLKSLVRDDDSGTYRWQMNLDGLRRSYGEVRGWPFETEQYDGPALFIAGGESPYIQAADRERIRRHFPDYRLETIPGVGHWLHAEARESFLTLVTGFLS